MLVAQIMNEAVDTCSPDDTIAGAAAVMQESDCGALPVCDARNRVVGIITDRDICLALGRGDLLPSTVEVQGLMSSDVHTCRPDATIEDAERMMRDHRVRRLPVVDPAGTILGMLTVEDIALHAIETAPEAVPARLRDVVETLAAIAHRQPRPARSR